MKRRGAFLPTFSGGRFYPLDPRVDEVRIGDIAHAHSLDCRWGGHCLWHVSVAQHVVVASYLGEPEEGLGLLMHDSPEAYLRDLPRPIKRDPAMSRYREIEADIAAVIAEAFGLAPRFWEEPVIERVDELMAATEWRDASGHDRSLLLAVRAQMQSTFTAPMADLPAPLEHTRIGVWTPYEAETAFLRRFAELTGRDVSEELDVATARFEYANDLHTVAVQVQGDALRNLLAAASKVPELDSVVNAVRADLAAAMVPR